MPSERLFKPRQRLSPLSIPESIKSLIPFIESISGNTNADDDFISFIDYFAFHFGIDYVNDFKEYAESNDFYLFFKEVFPENESQLLLVITYLIHIKKGFAGVGC